MCANRRMFNIEVTETNTFLDLPNESKLLYFYFGLNADDDGFISNPKMIQVMLGIDDDKYIKDLISNGYLISFNNDSLYVITHWKLNNELKKDRYRETIYKEEKKHIYLDENKTYRLSPERLQNVSKMSPQISKEKDSKEENRKEEGSTGKRKTGESEREEGGTHIVSVTDAYHILEDIGEASVDDFRLDQYQMAHIMQILSKSDKELVEQLDILRNTLEGSKITTDEFISIIEHQFD